MNKNYFSSYKSLGTGSYRCISDMPKPKDMIKWLGCSTKDQKINWYLKNTPWFSADMIKAIVDYEVPDKKELIIPSRKEIEEEEHKHETESFEYYKREINKKI